MFCFICVACDVSHSLKLTDGLRDMGQTATGLQQEVGGLVVVVRDNHNELHSHVKSSKAFIQMVRDQQVKLCNV